ncbi:putative RDD family membrane protein YckC [Glaciihabitans tibetensis]|uniref:Putative RDD family membrane protein YckC n=1 Tax=Glaciihabitans tibetensis TaxID=1266600 RepID=A0A2T0VFG0_9MICO|nr:RDD family protein [Glaciihabitans tibetensis]PRY68931.1 putative RDD family membrane protein YckC [Glaciihabitans tibetensis]
MPSAATPPQEQLPSETHRSDELITGEAVALDLRPTAFVLRAAGTLIDWALYLGGYLLLALLGLPLVIAAFGLDDSTAAAAAVVLLVLVLVIAPTSVELLSHGKSLGKLAVGGRIVRDDGGAIGFRHAFIRALTGVLEIFLTFGGLAALVALLNARSKRLGDLIAGTYCQYERVSREVVPVYGVPVAMRDWALTADVARMPDRVSRRIASFLRQAPRFSPGTRQRLASELASEASRWVFPMPGADVSPELFLAAVSALRRERELTALTLERERLERLAPALRGLPHGFPER